MLKQQDIEPDGGRPAALVVGSSRGIGLALATRLAQDGWSLTLSARSGAALDDAGARLAELAPVTTVAGDAASDSDLEMVVARHLEVYGRTDCLAIVAGTGTVGAWADYGMDRLDRQYGLNVRAPFRLIQLLLPSLRETASANRLGVARVIAIASINALVAQPHAAAYGATKAALASLCEALNVEESAQGVSATALCPGFVDTDMTNWVRDRVDPEQMIRVEDVAEIATTICRLSRHAVIPKIALTRPGQSLWRP